MITNKDLQRLVRYLQVNENSTMEAIADYLCLSDSSAARWLVYIETRLGLVVRRGKDSKRKGERMRYWIDGGTA